MLLASTLASLAACDAEPVARGSRPGRFDTSAVVTTFVGCYELRTSEHDYVVRLQGTRPMQEWDAQLLASPNTPGNSWSWAPIDSSHFRIRWGGIDGALEYLIERDGERLVGKETFASANTRSETARAVGVSRVSCPAPTG